MNRFKKALFGEQKNIYTFAMVDTSLWYDCFLKGIGMYNQRLLSFEKELRNQGLVFSKSTVGLNKIIFSPSPHTPVTQYLIANIPSYYLCHLFSKKEFCINYFIFGEVNGKSKFKRPCFYTFMKGKDLYFSQKDI